VLCVPKGPDDSIDPTNNHVHANLPKYIATWTAQLLAAIKSTRLNIM
jgi:hypothetical protein